jgi:glycosyltransferase involved in cell wall biosynthesis
VGRRRATLALPVYNERPRIRATLEEISEHVIRAIPEYEWEVVVVDDGSHDATLDEVVVAAEELDLPILVLAHEVNCGLGSTLSTIFHASRGELIVAVDADLTYSIEHVRRLVEVWERTGAAVVVASPYASGGSTRAVPRSLEVRSRMANRYLAAMTGSRVATFTGIVRAYDGDFVRSLPPLRGGANANIAVLHEAWRQRLEVVEMPAELDWTGQAYRRSRHALISRGSIGESWSVIEQGARLRRVTRTLERARSRSGQQPAVIDLRAPALPTPSHEAMQVDEAASVVPVQPSSQTPPAP